MKTKSHRIIYNNPLFGRLPRSGRSYLLKRGWTYYENQPDDDSIILSFIWPNKSGPQFDSHATVAPALVRPYPTEMTDLLDDKKRFTERISTVFGRKNDIIPECISINDIISDIPPPISMKISKTTNEEDKTLLYFVKHRRGAQGKSVYVYDWRDLQNWAKMARNPHDYVIQREVPPSLDEDGRKFVLRGHVLLYRRGGEQHDLMAYLHEDIISLSHAERYDDSHHHSSSSSKKQQSSAVHISQRGRHHPTPSLLRDLHPSHPAFGALDGITTKSATVVSATRHVFDEQPIVAGVTCFALLGVDYLVDRDDGSVKVCEVNSHPALGWGSMSAVPGGVFARLVEETLAILIFDEAVEKTRFRFLDWKCVLN